MEGRGYDKRGSLPVLDVNNADSWLGECVSQVMSRTSGSVARGRY